VWFLPLSRYARCRNGFVFLRQKSTVLQITV
jgi:hypothetical protein